VDVNNTTDQVITDDYAIYCGDCMQVLPEFENESIGMSIYSPPFCGLYNYSSSDYDMSNNSTYDGFMENYQFLVNEISRITKPGRMTVVHCMDIPNPGQKTGYYDLPGKIIKAHEDAGFFFFGRVAIWKEPLRVAIRTRLIHLTHKQLVKDSCRSTIAAGDYVLIFKKAGENKEPVTHETGFHEYFGERNIPEQLKKYEGETNQKKNKLSHWIWRQFASCFWDDIRIDNVLSFKEAKDTDDEKHVHPLQLDVVERCVNLWSNPGDVVVTPFMGVGSEVYGSVKHGRKGVGVELKPSYFVQAVRNLKSLDTVNQKQMRLF